MLHPFASPCCLVHSLAIINYHLDGLTPFKHLLLLLLQLLVESLAKHIVDVYNAIVKDTMIGKIV